MLFFPFTYICVISHFGTKKQKEEVLAPIQKEQSDIEGM